MNSDGTYIIVNSNDSLSGVWEFNSDESKVVFDISTPEESIFDILELTAVKWKTKFQDGTDNVEIIFIPY